MTDTTTRSIAADIPCSTDAFGTSVEDDAILKGLVAGDERFLAQAHRRHARAVYHIALGVLRRSELAEDVTQEIFVRLWEQPERFDPGRGSLGAFLKLDAKGRAVDLLRSEVSRANREEKEQRLSHATDQPATVEDEVLFGLASETIWSAVAQLDPDERAPITMAYLNGLSYRGVAEALGVPEGTVKSRIRRGLSNLRVALGSEPLPAIV